MVVKSFVGLDIENYHIVKYLSSGSFGDVYLGQCKNSNKKVAIKIPSSNKNSIKSLDKEIKIYNHLNIDKIVSSGISNIHVINFQDKQILVMDFLGNSLEKILSIYTKLSLKNVISIAIKSIEIIFYIHTKGIIHKDIKPDNFLVDDKLYCIDFGLSNKYLFNKKHIQFVDNYNFVGTSRFASISAHKGFEQSRKDDLESLGYMFVYLFEGVLPWQGIKHNDKKRKNTLILEKKLKINEDVLCKNLPKEFKVYLKYVKSLNFDEKPRYQSIIKMFKDLYQILYKKKYDMDNFFLDLQ